MQPPSNFDESVDRLRAHLPDVRTFRGLLRMLALPVLLFLLVTQLFSTSDMFGELWIMDVEILALTVGFLSLYLFFRLKEALQQRFGEEAYALAFKRFAAPGLAIIFAVVTRIRFIGGPEIPEWLLNPVGWVLGWLLVLTGVVLWVRAVTTFGLDSLTMVYVYHPREGYQMESAIYNILRHPVYAAALRIAYGLALINGTWFALTLAAVTNLFCWGWVRLVEEKELIARFGQEYEEYRRKTPAFLPHLRRLSDYFRLLILGR